MQRSARSGTVDLWLLVDWTDMSAHYKVGLRWVVNGIVLAVLPLAIGCGQSEVEKAQQVIADATRLAGEQAVIDMAEEAKAAAATATAVAFATPTPTPTLTPYPTYTPAPTQTPYPTPLPYIVCQKHAEGARNFVTTATQETYAWLVPQGSGRVILLGILRFPEGGWSFEGACSDWSDGEIGVYPTTDE